jgi:imidazole glycerol-phosphate synthase subunit HisF
MGGLTKRIIPCLDVDHGRTVKGVQFSELRDIGDPVELARIYQNQGADELVFLDISASFEGRSTMVSVVSHVAAELMIPFTVGGGISTLEQVRVLLGEGADKVSVNTAAVSRPELMSEIAKSFGAQCCVLAIDAKRFPGQSNAWEVVTHGGRTRTGMNVVDWAKQAVELGAGEILLTSWDKDGTLSGFDCALTRAVSEAVSVPVIASGGGSGPESFQEVFTEGLADAALAATIFHDGQWTVKTLKQAILQNDEQNHINLRLE